MDKTDYNRERILALLREREQRRDYSHNYLVPYKDYLDASDPFTDFNCERDEGKTNYMAMINRVAAMDPAAQIFVEVYSLEEDDDEAYIYADTLIIFSALPLADVKRIFSQSKDLFPSDVGELQDRDFYDKVNLVVTGDGALQPVDSFRGQGSHCYYCWWD